MTFIPSKRVDRIFPIIPPLCLLFVAMVAECRCGQRIRAWCAAAVVFATLFAGCYFAGIIWIGYHDGSMRVVEAGRAAAQLAGGRPLVVVDGRDEGLAMYAGAKSFSKTGAARSMWDDGASMALLVSERNLSRFENLPEPVMIAPGKREDRYFLFLRGEQAY